MSAIKVALVGCGRIAWQLEHDPLRYKPCTHLGALKYLQKRDKNLELTALCDNDLARAGDAAGFIGAKDALLTRKFSEVIRLKPDLLVIATDTVSHASILTAALAAKIPRIVVEKPVAFSAREAKRLRPLVAKSSSFILPNYERRYHVKYLGLKSKMGPGPMSYRGFFAAGGRSLYPDTKTRDEGVLLHDTTHLLDLALFFFGPVKKHSSIAGKHRHVLYLEHAGGSVGVLETALGVGAFHLELEIHTSKERILVGNGFISHERIIESPHYRGLKSYGPPRRTSDRKFPVAKNPFVKLYEAALYGRPDNSFFIQGLENAAILAGAL